MNPWLAFGIGVVAGAVGVVAAVLVWLIKQGVISIAEFWWKR